MTYDFCYFLTIYIDRDLTLFFLFVTLSVCNIFRRLRIEVCFMICNLKINEFLAIHRLTRPMKNPDGTSNLMQVKIDLIPESNYYDI